MCLLSDLKSVVYGIIHSIYCRTPLLSLTTQLCMFSLYLEVLSPSMSSFNNFDGIVCICMANSANSKIAQYQYLVVSTKYSKV